MIAKMSKYSFLVYHAEFNGFLETLRKIGVVHVKEKAEGLPDDEQVSQKLTAQKQVAETIKYLKSRKVGGAENNGLTAIEVVGKVKQLRDGIEALNVDLQSTAKKINQLKPWGDFSWDTLAKLKAVGKHLLFYSCNRSKYDPNWKNKYELFEISRLESNIYFVVVSESGALPGLQADLLKLPNESYGELLNQTRTIESSVSAINQQLDSLAASSIEKLETYNKGLKSETDFRKAVLTASDNAASKVKLLEGWVPADNEEEINAALDNAGIFYLKSDPSLTESVPVLLKNNSFTKLFEMVGSLYALPNYREIDLTPFFAPFFMLFFGFCLGDAGYGLLMMVATLVLRAKAKPNMKPVWTLGFFFGLSTVIMGIVGGTFFGIMLIDFNFSWLGIIQGIMLDQNQLMIFAVLLGVIQIVFGIVLKAARLVKMKGFSHALSTIGWLIVIVGMGGSFALGKYGAIDQSTATPLMIGTGAVGGVLALFFNTPGKNLFLNFGLGLWDTYSMVTGLLGDVLSYIRLFALGLSSAILGSVFNQLAFELTGNTPVISQLLTVLILLLGHSINFFMAALGAFVHPLRLTFVEFFKNTGFSGGGLKYEPFREVEGAKY
jgi:V/A-type H+/Na+-transporting ATPase subunit I